MLVSVLVVAEEERVYRVKMVDDGQMRCKNREPSFIIHTMLALYGFGKGGGRGDRFPAYPGKTRLAHCSMFMSMDGTVTGESINLTVTSLPVTSQTLPPS